MEYFVYILFSDKFGKYYIGQTNNLEGRLKKHNSGNVISTKPYIPYRIVWSCSKPSRQEAMELEKKLKNLKSKIRLKKFIEKYS
jgi:putative endonuclease